eukprot:TRINITY_DN10322_c0_g1_i3.p1 TRINITY_DN10322_c0_g1~~TRINITY_DN10322_c0_g1_i3.p1  ORF type:complete len:282 (+),score=48.39 TRINITY_DN10322_c0_g1_i3:69-848(+)
MFPAWCCGGAGATAEVVEGDKVLRTEKEVEQEDDPTVQLEGEPEGFTLQEVRPLVITGVQEATDVSLKLAEPTKDKLPVKEPPGEQATFCIELTKLGLQDLGLTLDMVRTDSEAIVVRIAEGEFMHQWNNSRGPTENKLRCGDRILQVNDVRGSQMPAACTGASDLKLWVKRREERALNITKVDSSLGLDIRLKSDHEGVIITKICDGPVKTWNENNPNAVINAQDRIVEANGVSGDNEKILFTIRESKTLALTIVSFS